MKKLFVAFTLLVAGAMLAALVHAVFFAQRADYGWRPEVARQTFTLEKPRVLFDEGHHNASAGFGGRYWPFARLLRADGYTVERSNGPFTAQTLEDIHVLVIANAAGAPRLRLLGIDLPSSDDAPQRSPAFTPSEIELVRSWVASGGSLLLIADHAPFAEAVASLASNLGVGMHMGRVEIPGRSSVDFSLDNGRLGHHPILHGGDPEAAVGRVVSYDGQSLDGPPGATVLLRLPRAAVQYVPAEDGSLVERPAGRSQGVAFEYGSGRVVVLGEGDMVTALVSRRVRHGINAADNDNQQFVLNVMGWLVGVI